ncbi:hypothetical protein quinque_004161 [Culex quinquefasciatus]
MDWSSANRIKHCYSANRIKHCYPGYQANHHWIDHQYQIIWSKYRDQGYKDNFYEHANNWWKQGTQTAASKKTVGGDRTITLVLKEIRTGKSSSSASKSKKVSKSSGSKKITVGKQDEHFEGSITLKRIKSSSGVKTTGERSIGSYKSHSERRKVVEEHHERRHDSQDQFEGKFALKKVQSAKGKKTCDCGKQEFGKHSRDEHEHYEAKFALKKTHSRKLSEEESEGSFESQERHGERRLSEEYYGRGHESYDHSGEYRAHRRSESARDYHGSGRRFSGKHRSTGHYRDWQSSEEEYGRRRSSSRSSGRQSAGNGFGGNGFGGIMIVNQPGVYNA